MCLEVKKQKSTACHVSEKLQNLKLFLCPCEWALSGQRDSQKLRFWSRRKLDPKIPGQEIGRWDWMVNTQWFLMSSGFTGASFMINKWEKLEESTQSSCEDPGERAAFPCLKVIPRHSDLSITLRPSWGSRVHISHFIYTRLRKRRESARARGSEKHIEAADGAITDHALEIMLEVLECLLELRAGEVCEAAHSWRMECLQTYDGQNRIGFIPRSWPWSVWSQS